MDSTPRYNLTSSNTVGSTVPRSRGTSPVAMTKTDKLYTSNYTPYKSYQLSSTTKKDTPTSGSTSRRGSRDDVSRIGSAATAVTASIKPGVSRYRTTSTSSIRSSREDLSRIGTTSTGSSNRGVFNFKPVADRGRIRIYLQGPNDFRFVTGANE